MILIKIISNKNMESTLNDCIAFEKNKFKKMLLNKKRLFREPPSKVKIFMDPCKNKLTFTCCNCGMHVTHIPRNSYIHSENCKYFKNHNRCSFCLKPFTEFGSNSKVSIEDSGFNLCKKCFFEDELYYDYCNVHNVPLPSWPGFYTKYNPKYPSEYLEIYECDPDFFLKNPLKRKIIDEEVRLTKIRLFPWKKVAAEKIK